MDIAPRDRDQLIALVEQYREFTGPFPFTAVIEAVFGHTVIGVDVAEAETAALLGQIHDAASSVLAGGRGAAIHAATPQNAGTRMKPLVLQQLQDAGLVAAVPQVGPEGDQPRQGYPDYRVAYGRDRIAYILTKTYSMGSANSAFRRIYLSPPDHPAFGKVTSDAIHLLLAFGMEREANDHWPVSARLVDLSNVPVQLKYEFQSSMASAPGDFEPLSLWEL